jgi:signal transduction histidine kinase
MRRRSLRNQIAVWFGGSLFGVVGCILLVLQVRIDAETRAQVSREMRNAERVLSYVLQARAETLEARARSIGDLPKLGALVDTRNPLTIQDVAREYPSHAECDFVMLTNAQGTILAHTTEPRRNGESAARQRGVAEALRGNAVVGIRAEPQGVFQVASAPVRAGGELTGTVSLGFALNDDFAQRLRAASGTHLTFVTGTRISASTLGLEERAELLAALGGARGAQLAARGHDAGHGQGPAPTVGGAGRVPAEALDPSEAARAAAAPADWPAVVRMRGQQYLTLAKPILDDAGRPIGAYLIQKSVDDALYPYRNIQRWLLAIGLTGLMLGMLASYLLARDITEPILRVVSAAEALGRGDWSQRVTSNARDEVGVLAQTFNAMAARLQSWDADLRAAVAERTAELNQAVVRLDVAFEKMRRFNADASHELRTPLTIVRGEAEVALRSPRPAPEYERVLRSILEETEHMGHLIDGLLTLARADSGELKLEARPISLHELLSDLYQQAQVLAREKGIRVAFDCPPSLQAHGDELRLRQLFLNLLDNAVKYTGPGGRVWLEAWEEAGQPVVRVRDTGIGIAPGDVPHLFDRFFRVDKARGREAGGSGLGLSICKWIVDAHGGTISVESQPGGGTSFGVRLPAGEQKMALRA